MASAQGNGVLLVTQYIPAVNAQPLQQNTPIGQNDGWLQKFIKGEPKSLGVVQVMIGVIHICLGAILASTLYLPATVAVASGIVFWGPIFFFVSGGLSIASEKNRNISQVKGALGMNIVSAVVAMLAFSFYVADLCTPRYYYNSYNNYNGPYDGDCYRNCYAAQILSMGILVVLSLLSLLECCISISTSAFGCRSVCGNSGSQTGQPVFVIQNAVPQDARFQPMQTISGIPIAQGMPPMGQVMTMAPGATVMQGMPPSYIGMITPGITLTPGVASAPIPTTETPPSYYKTIPGDALSA